MHDNAMSLRCYQFHFPIFAAHPPAAMPCTRSEAISKVPPMQISSAPDSEAARSPESQAAVAYSCHMLPVRSI